MLESACVRGVGFACANRLALWVRADGSGKRRCKRVKRPPPPLQTVGNGARPGPTQRWLTVKGIPRCRRQTVANGGFAQPIVSIRDNPSLRTEANSRPVWRVGLAE